MNVIREYLNLGFGALFLNEETYAKLRDDSQRLVKGFLFILFVGVLVALVAMVGKILEWSTTPDLSNLKNIVLQEMQNTQWFRAMARSPEGMRQFQQGYDLWWQIFGGMFSVNLLGSLANAIINPIMLTLRWLVYGIVAFVCARLLGSKGDLTQTLGCTALAVAPEMLNALQVFPYVQLGGVGVWGLVCSYVGIKIANQLSPWRAFWATLLPVVLFIVLALIFGCICNVALGSMIGNLMGGGR